MYRGVIKKVGEEVGAYVFLVGIIFLINIILVFSLIFIERKEPNTTWAWLLILLILPGVGFIIYLILGQNLSRQKLFREKKLVDKIKTKEVKEKHELNKKHDREFIENYRSLILMNYNHSGALYTDGNDVKTYTNGEDKFRDLFNDIRSAKKFIHIEYYIFRFDDLGTALINELELKVQEGVEVRLLVDGMGSKSLKKKEIRYIESIGIKFAVFFPGILPHINTRINYRNHRKIVVIDGKIGYVGGFNVGNEYINKGKQFKFWRDTHIRVRGEAVNELNKRFILDWDYAADEKIGNMSTQMFKEFFRAFVNESRITLHITLLYGENDHHKIEGIFKAFGRALKEAIRIETNIIPSSKGCI